jgi:hypothetical protein
MMSADSPQLPSDAQLLYEYLGRRIDRGADGDAGQDVVADLAAYQEQLDRLRTMVREAEASLDAGEGRELDVEALLKRVHARIAAEGQSS